MRRGWLLVMWAVWVGCSSAPKRPDDAGVMRERGFILVKPGTFVMGSPDAERGREANETRQTITLTRPIWVARTEVTQQQWREVMGGLPESLKFRACGPTCPVESISWYDALAYANARSRRDGLPQCYALEQCTGKPGQLSGYRCAVIQSAGSACRGYRLPTEAEWEYFARAGTTTATPGGDLSALDTPARELEKHTWYLANSSRTPQRVAQLNPNPWGLFDTLGNVSEWTWDVYLPGARTSARDPGGDAATVRGNAPHTVRGCSWLHAARRCRAAYRADSSSDARAPGIGLRLVRTAR